MLITQVQLYQAAQIHELEQIAINEHHINAYELMERAGAVAFRELQLHWPQAKRIVVVCGKGNNAGDGYILSSLAKLSQLNIEILQVVPDAKLSEAAHKAAAKCKKMRIKTSSFDVKKLAEADVIVDAMLGTGLKGELQAPFLDAIVAINASKKPVLALDLPSGVEADTGNVCGAAVKATLTVTFIGQKIGLVTGEAQNYCGKLTVDNLSLPDAIFTRTTPIAHTLQLDRLLPLLPKRQRTSHKGDYGHVLVVGGDLGMGGAVRMAAEAATRVGAGLVSVATRPENVAAIIATRPEIMAHGINAPKHLDALIERATVLILGPGLGLSAWSNKLFARALTYSCPMVVDADALKLLARKPQKRANWVLTPHPGEAGKLLGITSQQVQSGRVNSVKQLQQEYGGISVLKGAGTLILAEGLVSVCTAGNPGMASGGMGDILSGVIGGLLAQGLNLSSAAKLGVLLHATAGDMAANEHGERGMLALDLLPYIRKILNFNP